jgi:hypothetical protein
MVIRIAGLLMVQRGALQLGLNGAEKSKFRRKHGRNWLEEMHKQR